MTAKTSQLYQLFQNKAYHYQNIQTARSKVQDHLSRNLNNTINVIEKQKYDRDFPVNKRYSINVENKRMTDRISNIYERDPKVINKDGKYARFNKFQRDFRTKNHYKSEQQRLIELENKKIKSKIQRMKSGSTKYWKGQYTQQKKFTKKMTSTDHRSSQSNLHFDSSNFVAKPYLEFINNLKNDKKQTIDDSKVSQKSCKSKSKEHISIQHEKIFELPQFPPKEQKLKRSKVSLSSLQNGSVQEEKKQ